MSRTTKWKLEKAKVKVVFRLQFHATQIPQSGWDKLFISFISTETGKATAKTSKANVKNGACKWADPIYETTRLLLDSKSKQYDDKLYKLVVGMGTSRSSILGEATINLADYAEASQPSAINLPLHGSDLGTILHVTVQLLTAKTGFREFEQQRDKGLQRESESSTPKSPSLDLQIPDDQLNKVKTQRQVRPQSEDLLEATGIHEEYSDSQITCDDSSNASESYKNDPSIIHEVDSNKNSVSRFSEKRNGLDDLAITYEENQRLRGSLEVAESSISELKMELNTLQNHANEMNTETQKLQQELVTEITSSQELKKEVNVLKSECSKFKNDLEQLKELKSSSKLIPNVPLQELTTEGQHLELLKELEIEKSKSESLVKKMEQMECYYEALVQDLEENQKKILGEFQILKNEHSKCAYSINDQMGINKDLQKRATTSESALKRARLNYSIAVSQLQKDLDMLSFQVLSMFETNQTVIKEAFSDSSEGHEDLVDHNDHRSKHLSGDLKKSLSLQENIYKKVEEELSEMCASNLYLDVYSGTLKGTLLEACIHIRNTNEKLQELGRELEVSNESRDVLFMRLQTAMEDVHAMNAQSAYYREKCNDLELQNRMLETDLGSVSRENFLLMEKITECEALLMDYKVYKSKHEVVSAEKVDLEGLLEVQVFDNQKLQKDLEFLNQELESLRSQLHDLEMEKDMARSKLDDVKMRFKNGVYEMVAKSSSSIQDESLEKIQFQVESVSKKLKNSLDLGESHLENSEAILRYLSGLELELQKMSSEDKSFVEQITGFETMGEEFEKSKLLISELEKENQDFVLELDRMKECLKRVNDELDVEKGIKGKLEGTIACLTADLESQRLELDHVRRLASNQESEKLRAFQLLAHHEDNLEKLHKDADYSKYETMICEDLKLTFIKSQYESKIDELVKLCKELNHRNLDLDSRLNEENNKLSRTLESVQLKLNESIAQNAEMSESKNVLEQWKDKAGMFEISLKEVNNQHALELGQLKDTLAKCEVEIGQLKGLEMKLHDTEGRLNLSLENEARYVKDNENLVKELECVKLELEEMLESKNDLKGKVGILEINLMEVNNQHEVELCQLKDMLAKSGSEIEQYKELQMKLDDTEARLNDCIASEACYIEENKKLARTLKSVQLELQASVAHNAEILESKNVLEGKMGILEIDLKDMLVKYELEVEKCKELEMKLDDTETRLNEVVRSEDCYMEENNKLSRTLESVRLELKDSIAQNAEMSESINEHALELSQLKEMLVKSEVEIARLKELETEFFVTKTRLDQFVKSEAFYIEENESLRLELDDVAEVDDVAQESEILLVVLKSKLYEQNDELIMLKNKCNELTHKLSEQILKTEEFKNLSVYLKELKDNADVSREKKEPEGQSESLRVAFIKEQYQAKLQELKQQLAVSKRHNEEMLFKLQDALDEIESRKKSEALQLQRIQELEAEVESVVSQKPDHDRIQAELECALLSLECCKEEKEKLVVLLQECEDEKSKLADEVSSIKEQLALKDENGHTGVNLQVIQRGVHGEDEEDSLLDTSKQLAVINDQFRAQNLRTYMEQLDEELEKMKNDNSILPLANYDPGLQGLQKELSQLQKANEELGSIYPNFIDFPGNGNALERVLALEIELAEALRAKKKSSIQFQSSFLKQHSDEEAVFKSFRDINELIKDMLEIKGKYVNVESELKDMHDRYSQLSLQFAEVEGERQKLMMTLKNVRSSRNLLRLNRSSMAAIEDRPL